MSLNLNVTTKENESLISLSGDLDIYTSPEFSKGILNEFEKNGKDIVIDASQLDYIDSTGLGAFISVYKALTESSKTIKLINVKPNVKKIFVITELDKLFKIEE
ncbi:STAS domain-containing protein [Microaceticoccus formicicus]|uniref:STAS domain-containing protein n=1 Tax=Microaceticoccus formicicus TaxID=3118105 RepID=UPI003CD00D05|nr:STAS domain-containing protein [Peptoniphilaceae bacterium AMB_02]